MADELEQALHNYDDGYLNCRDVRHAWRVVGYYHQAGEIRRVLQCRHCPTQRIDRWDASGDRIASQYDHPDDYKLGLGVSQYDIRHEVLRRVKVYASQSSMVTALAKSRSAGRKR